MILLRENYLTLGSYLLQMFLLDRSSLSWNELPPEKKSIVPNNEQYSYVVIPVQAVEESAFTANIQINTAKKTMAAGNEDIKPVHISHHKGSRAQADGLCILHA